MTSPGHPDPIPLSRSQRNIYNGVLQDTDPSLYLVARRYRFHPLELPVLVGALEATIRKNPIQLCVLAEPAADGQYPGLVLRLSAEDIVTVCDDETRSDGGAEDLQRAWARGILGAPLTHYVVRTDAGGNACGLDAFTHHILLDGGATGIIEADLGQYLSAGTPPEKPCAGDGLARLALAHRRESDRVSHAHERLSAGVQRELSEDARHGGYGQNSAETPGTAARGVLRESVRISGPAYEGLVALSEAEQVPLNILVSAAAVAVDASVRQSTVSLLIHAADNRFGEPDLDVATCLVNSVAQPVRFAPFASVADVVATLDRGYVRAVRRKWLREEHYRRMYLAINRATHVEALTLNFLREPCAPALRPHLSETPVTTAIGPVESTAVASVLDEQRRVLDIAIWERADVPTAATGFAHRIAAVLAAMPTSWHLPIATTVDAWFGVDADGARCRVDPQVAPAVQSAPPAWFLADDGAAVHRLRRRRHIEAWIAWLVHNGVAPGDLLVFTDEGTDTTVDLLIASHLAGCGYSVCDTASEITARVASITEHSPGATVHAIDVAATPPPIDTGAAELVQRRIDEVSRDPGLAAAAAYIMPTSGSTGSPKLVRISHRSLALFCEAVSTVYGWGPEDTVLQCAPLTSDISVEEVFGSARCGARLVRSGAMKAGDLQALAHDLVAHEPTVADLPTAVWHLLCDDEDALDAIRRCRLRQIIVGGEAIRSAVIDRWADATAAQDISLISTYGPTEATIVASYLPIVSDGVVADRTVRPRLGSPMVPGTVFLAFGEVVIVGDLVAAGYLGIDSASFGTVATGTGARLPAFATADRVIIDADGFPVLAGRRDAVVKVAGRRVDTAEITRRICAVPGIVDVAVELRDGTLGVWFETGDADADSAAAHINALLAAMRVPSFVAVETPHVPRKPNGKIDSATLPPIPQSLSTPDDPDADERAVGLAQLWSRLLGRAIEADTSLLDAGVGSLDLIRMLPDTRRYLARPLSILDLISADTAAHLIDDATTRNGWMDAGTAAEIDHDMALLPTLRPQAGAPAPRRSNKSGRQAILVLGASGILGTGVAEAALDLTRTGTEFVFVTRRALPDRYPWTSLRDLPGVRVEVMPGGFGRDELDDLLRDNAVGTVLNCVGNTNVLAPYRALRAANVELVSAAAQACAGSGARLVHLSTFVVNADVTAPRVTDPRQAPYPYAASKAMAELAVAGSASPLDATIVRLPRVLGQPEQMADSADILTALVDACTALWAHPAIALTEEVTTSRAAAEAILAQPPQDGGLTVLRGQQVDYGEFLSEYGSRALEAAEWKRLLDTSDWARQNPLRWSVIDAWFALGGRLGNRTYSEYLATFGTVALDITATTELAAPPDGLRELLLAEHAYRAAFNVPTSEEWQ